jgi:hypothetical protein
MYSVLTSLTLNGVSFLYSASLERQVVSDLGVKSTSGETAHFTAGWFDALGRGVANDYCRLVGHHRRPFLSCALAGTRSQYSAPGRFRITATGGVERDPCFQKRCGTHGKCAPTTGRCACLHGYSGVECEIPSDACLDVNCGAHGLCKGGYCSCARGWHGTHCELNKCWTAGLNCGEHGVCFDGACHCTPKYTGVHCQYKSRQTIKTLDDWGLESLSRVDADVVGSSGPSYVSGWFDLQGQSGDVAVPHVLNDYCRWVSSNPPYFSCALAGSTDQYTPPGQYIWDTASKKPKLNLCYGIDCGVNGDCEAATGTCRCHGTFSGARCEITLALSRDACKAITCGTNGYCSAGQCICRENWSGARCEIDACATLKVSHSALHHDVIDRMYAHSPALIVCVVSACIPPPVRSAGHMHRWSMRVCRALGRTAVSISQASTYHPG